MSLLDELRTDAGKKWNVFLKEKAEEILTGKEMAFLPWRHKGVKITPENALRLKDEVKELSKGEEDCLGYRLEWDKCTTRNFGTQTYIKEIVIDTEDDYVSFVRKKMEYESFCKTVEDLKAFFEKHNGSMDSLSGYIRSILSAVRTIRDKSFWSGIIRCLEWFISNPASGKYMRQVPAGVGTKFVENNQWLLKTLYCLVTGTDGSDKSFTELVGLREYNVPVHFRVKSPVTGVGDEEQCLSLQSFSSYDTVLEQAQLNKGIRRVIVIENLKTFLTFPVEDGTMAIWGGGFSANSRLKGCSWLRSRELYYWGDIDESGFAILYHFREDYPEAKSFLMDRTVFEKWKKEAVRVDIGDRFGGDWQKNLTAGELETLNWLKAERIEGRRNRLEQELIPDEEVEKAWRS